MVTMLYYFGKGKYDKEYGELWDELVPNSGQAKTIQGELVRTIGRLASESYRNGNGNWDAGFRIMVRFLQKHLNDKKVFDAKTLGEIKADLQLIGDMGNGSSDLDYTKKEDPYDRITDRVVEWCQKNPNAIKLAKIAKLKR